MQYKEAIELFEEVIASYKGNLYFDSGTLNDLNKDDNRNYPLVFLVRPVTIPQSYSINNNSVSQTFNFTLNFLQSSASVLNEDNYTNVFNDTLQILNGFVGKLIALFEEEGTDVMTIGTITQVFLNQDNIHVGWSLPLQIQSVVNSDLCCSAFEI